MSLERNELTLARVTTALTAVRALSRRAKCVVVGDSRCAGYRVDAGSTKDRSALGALGPGCNLLSNDKWEFVNPGEDFTFKTASWRASQSPANNFAAGSQTVDQTLTLLTKALQYDPDIVILQGGFNSLPSSGGGSNIDAPKGQRMREIKMVLDAGKLPLILTTWDSTAKDATGLAAWNAWNISVCDLYGIPYIDIAAAIVGQDATYLCPSESPQVHWSIYGWKWFCATIANKLDSLTAKVSSGDVLSSKALTVTYPAEQGMVAKELFTGTGGSKGSGITGSLATGWTGAVQNITSEIDAAGTSVSGAAVCSLVEDTDYPGTYIQTLTNTNGASSYIYKDFSSTDGCGFEAGDWLKLECEIQCSGLEAGVMHLTIPMYHRDSAGAWFNWNACRRLQGDAGDWPSTANKLRTCGWGLLSFLVRVTPGMTVLRPLITLEQADDTVNGSAGAYTGAFSLRRMTLTNLTRMGGVALPLSLPYRRRQGLGAKAVTSADVTLTDTEQSYETLQFTGVKTANRVVSWAPIVGGVYHIDNQTTGAFTLTIKGRTSAGVTGTGLVLTNGKQSIVFWNGTDFVRLAAETP